MFAALDLIANEKAWDGLDLTVVTDDDLVDVLSYHVRSRLRSADDRLPLLP